MTGPGTDSEFLQHEPCPSCGSSDALARYTDGHGFCFSCGAYEKPDGEAVQQAERRSSTGKEFVSGEVKPLPKRGISEETSKKWGYQVGKYKGKTVQVANYYRDGLLVGQKLRDSDKNFIWIGEKDPGLYGEWLWRDGGKKLVVVEGEVDALTVSQLQGNKWPVVSIPHGAPSAKKAIQKSIEWLDRFEEVVFLFDQDEPGQKAARECALLLKPGKAKIASLPLKDPNEMLLAGRGAEVIDSIWGAKVYRPDGIVSGVDTWEMVRDFKPQSDALYPWPSMNTKPFGLRYGEIVTFCAGSGIGKSTLCREIAFNLGTSQGESVGMVELESSVTKSSLALMSLEANTPLHLTNGGLSETERRAVWERSAGNGRFHFYDHFGSLESDNLMSKLRYLVLGAGCRWLVLDHISIVVSGIGDGDERRLIDNLMTNLRSFAENTRCGLILVSHLRKAKDGPSHEEGGRVTLDDLRGSGAIKQLSDIIWGIERDQQGGNPNVLTARLLKNRYAGVTGVGGYLEYVPSTGRVVEVDQSVFDAEEDREEDSEF